MVWTPPGSDGGLFLPSPTLVPKRLYSCSEALFGASGTGIETPDKLAEIQAKREEAKKKMAD